MQFAMSAFKDHQSVAATADATTWIAKIRSMTRPLLTPSRRVRGELVTSEPL